MIETGILVEIDLQVFIFTREDLLAQRYTFFFIFCHLLDGMPGLRELCVSPWPRNSFAFFP